MLQVWRSPEFLANLLGFVLLPSLPPKRWKKIRGKKGILITYSAISDHDNTSWNFIFPTFNKYVIPKSSEVGHWLSKIIVHYGPHISEQYNLYSIISQITLQQPCVFFHFSLEFRDPNNPNTGASEKKKIWLKNLRLPPEWKKPC